MRVQALRRTARTLRPLAAAFLLGAWMGPALCACSKPMTMHAEHFPPYLFEDPDHAGLDVLLTRAIFKEAGCTLIVAPPLPQMLRWERFEHGKFDLMTGASDVAERHRFARFSVPYRDETVSLFTTDDKFALLRDVDGFDSMIRQNLTLLAPRTGWYGDDYESHKAALRKAELLVEFTSLSQGIQRIGAGRAAFIMSDAVAVRYESERQGVHLQALSFNALHAPVHLMLSKVSTTQDDVAQLNAAIERLSARGVLEAIRQPYGVR